jgi:hypothetical protein
MVPLITEPDVRLETVRDEPRRVEVTVRELVRRVDPTPLINMRFVVETVDAPRVD